MENTENTFSTCKNDLSNPISILLGKSETELTDDDTSVILDYVGSVLVGLWRLCARTNMEELKYYLELVILATNEHKKALKSNK